MSKNGGAAALATKDSPARHAGTARRWFLAIIVFLLASPAAGLGLWLGGLQLAGNFHVVEPGIVYRSAQLGDAHLREAVLRNKIRSIINLRGPYPDAAWYRREIVLAETLGVKHYDFPLSATRTVDFDRMSQLLALVRLAPKPVLIHCQSGADRSGLASALFEYAVMLRKPEEAAEQLSLWYGHFPYLWSRTGAMDESFGAFVRTRGPNTPPSTR